jgi:hypothetical protein
MSLTISTIRDAVKAQLNANLAGGPQRQVTIDAHGDGAPAPVIRLELDEPPRYHQTFGPPSQLQSVTFLVTIDPGNADGSAVRRLDDFLSAGIGNGESVIDALDADPTIGGVAMHFDFEPRDYDPVNVTASYALTIHVQDS